MATVHFLNVGQGDCTLIRHNSGRNTLIDVCKGNYTEPAKTTETIVDELLEQVLAKRVGRSGNYGMSKRPTNPIDYLRSLGVEDLFRFILTHPDMDHMDGLDALFQYAKPGNFWDSGVRRAKPDFSADGHYLEADWDRYESVIAGKETGTTVLRKNQGDLFQFANRNEQNEPGADGLYILAPDQAIVDAANDGEAVNDASYVILYRSAGGRILIPGDAHDDTWAFVLKHHRAAVENCDVLFAPHHGRRSGADFSFLDVVNPRVTFFGCANSGHLAYDQWSRRGLEVVTNNQAGNIVLDCTDAGIRVYVENDTFAEACGAGTVKNAQGYSLLMELPVPATV